MRNTVEWALPLCDLMSKNQKTLKKIAIICPVIDSECLQKTILFANTVVLAARLANEACQVILYYLDCDVYHEYDFGLLESGIQRRLFDWEIFTGDEAERAMYYANFDNWQAQYKTYSVINDGMKNAFDCDLWWVASDCLAAPLLPIKPNIFIVNDAEYQHVDAKDDLNQTRKNTILESADHVWVSTEWIYHHVFNEIPIQSQHLMRMPMILPNYQTKQWQPMPLSAEYIEKKQLKNRYLIWIVPMNQGKAVECMANIFSLYYGQYQGQLTSVILGAAANDWFDQHFELLGHMRTHFILENNVSHSLYRMLMSNATCLLHMKDGDVVSICDGAAYGVPTLSQDHPMIREIDDQYQLQVTYFDIEKFSEVAQKIKWMEDNARVLAEQLSGFISNSAHYNQDQAVVCWSALKECV